METTDDDLQTLNAKKPNIVVWGLTGTQLAVQGAVAAILLSAVYFWVAGSKEEELQDHRVATKALIRENMNVNKKLQDQDNVINALIRENQNLQKKDPLDAKKEDPRMMVLRLSIMIETELGEMEKRLADPKMDLEIAVDVHYRSTAWDFALNYAFIRGDKIDHEKIRDDWVMHRMLMEKLGHLKDIPGTGHAVPHHELKALFTLRNRAAVISRASGHRMIQLKADRQKKKAA